MQTPSLLQNILQTNTIHFRDIPLGSPLELVLEKEGTPTEIKEYSNPFYHYFIEIGEMEELNIYYNYETTGRLVKEISLYFIHYPDHYWKQAGNSDPVAFWDLLQTNQLQPFSEVFYNTVHDVLAAFTTLFKQEPEVSAKPAVPFDALHHAYKSYTWTDDVHYLNMQTYVDDSIDDNVRNTMILKLGHLK